MVLGALAGVDKDQDSSLRFRMTQNEAALRMHKKSAGLASRRTLKLWGGCGLNYKHHLAA
jgi:hypothetical protein